MVRCCGNKENGEKIGEWKMSRAYIFWLGYLSHLCLVGVVQDYQGKEKWLEMTDLLWIDTRVWYWFLFMAAYIAIGIVSNYANIPRTTFTVVPNDSESEDEN